MAKRAVIQILFAFLLLAGQQVALVHSVWHLGKHSPVQRADDPARTSQHDQSDGKSSQSRLCDLHSTLGTLLTGECGGVSAAIAITSPLDIAIYSLVWFAAQPSTFPPSRAPPVLL
jgi:hypothetical protein